jgi:gamma-carbonic anhydrase
MTADERLRRHLHRSPDTARAAFIAPGADIMGDVTLGQDSSVWYRCVLRGDINSITVGDGTNLQDGTIVHLADDAGVTIGARCTIGHRALIHACTIGDDCLIGMAAVILDHARIGPRCLIGAGSLVTKGTEIPEGSLALGSPARVIRPLTAEEIHGITAMSAKYVAVARAHASLLHK